MTCPSVEDLLGAYEAAGADGGGVESHLATGCPVCNRRWRLFATMFRALAHGPLPFVRPELHRAALAPARPRPRGLLEPVRELVARLVFDSLAPAAAVPAAALRSGDAPGRHLLYHAGAFEVDLALLESGSLVGQVLADDGEEPLVHGGVCILSGEDDTRLSELESNGDFYFEGVGPGSYVLLVEGPDLRLVVPELELGPDGDGGRPGAGEDDR